MLSDTINCCYVEAKYLQNLGRSPFRRSEFQMLFVVASYIHKRRFFKMAFFRVAALFYVIKIVKLITL